MAFLTVTNAGLFCTVQDLGRPGWSWAGVPRGGAADPVSLRLGNALVGNHPRDAAIETTLMGGAFAFDSPGVVAVTGAVCDVEVIVPGGMTRPVPWCRPVNIEAGSTIRIGRCRRGCRVYLSVRGGLVVPEVMGSRSTHTGACFGGHQGRPLRVGDQLVLAGESCGPLVDPPAGTGRLLLDAVMRSSARVVMAPMECGFDGNDLIGASRWKVSPRSDRMGIRLMGEPIPSPFHGRMPSRGMMWGAVQVPPGGEPIVLACDHPTTGGYPVAACVIEADLSVIGQWSPGDTVDFVPVSHAQARRALLDLDGLFSWTALETGRASGEGENEP